MRTIAILPIKSLGAAKQRLSTLLGRGSREALAQAMLLDVLASLRRVREVEEIAVVTGSKVAEDAAEGRGITLLRDREDAGQSAAAKIGIRHAVERGFERALLVPGDTPLLDPGEVAEMLVLAQQQRTPVTVVPDRHGAGTNALLLAPPRAIEPSFGVGSLERHLAAARAGGLVNRVARLPSLMLDIDTPDDLAELAEDLEARRGSAPMTRGALRQLDNSKVSGRAAPAVRIEA
jgi:2-phospho-L-lactate guanylyltransferase